MRVVVQRVKWANVKISGELFSQIGEGLLVLLGITHDDSTLDVEWLTKKVSQLRIFDDKDGVMNLSVKEINGDVMVVSQFTLFAKTAKGNRPAYINAAPHDIAIPLYNEFVEKMQVAIGKKVATGKFGEYMKIELLNDGPVTIMIDSKNRE